MLQVEARLVDHEKKIADLDMFQKDVNARLATIEERTGNMIKGLDRIELKMDNTKTNGGR